MKRMLTIALTLMLLATLASAGPLSKGAMKLGGTVGFEAASGDWYENSNGDGPSTFSVMPSFGYFFSDGFCAGIDFAFSKTSNVSFDLETSDIDYTEFAFGPMVSYFFGAANITEAKGKAVPYISAHFMIANQKWEDESNWLKYKGTSFGARLAMAYFMTNSVALDFGVDFDSDSFKVEEDGGFESESISGTRFGFSAGISAFVI